MSARDPELTRLLVLELERHAAELGALEPAAVRRALHAMKGAAGLAGEGELAGALVRLERRHARGDGDVRAVALALVLSAAARLRDGRPALESRWPVPPVDLEPTEIPAHLRATYTYEVKDRLAAIDAALHLERASEAIEDALRHLHTIKGAASAAGDEPMVWFCHGLEEHLGRARREPRAAEAALSLLGQHRAILAGLLGDSGGTLALLRGPAERDGRARSTRPGPVDLGEETVRIGRASVDALLDGFQLASSVRDGVGARASADARAASELRAMRAELADALRLIGPPRPWGAPAVALRRVDRAVEGLARLSGELERRAVEGREADGSLRELTAHARRELVAMRKTPARDLFGRVAAAIAAEARRAGREVRVVQVGADEPLDRRLAEQLLDPCLALARNALAHGIEPPERRAELQKDPTATVTLTARRAGTRLVVGVADDGAGVDVDALRARALARGAISAALADAADDDTLLALLFVPGLSTREHADALAGRGVGLDLAQSAVEQLGGTLRVESRRGLGFEARIEVPMDLGVATLLWVRAHGVSHGVLAANARAVRAVGRRGARGPHLGECLEPGEVPAPTHALELDVGDGAPAPLTVGVDGVEGPEEALVRPVSPLLRGAGPYMGAVLGADGGVRLVLDVPALALRARALGRVADSVRISEPPRGVA